MRAPKPAVQLQRLQTQIDELLDDAYIYSAPVAGENRSAFLMTDLTGDGSEDAVVLMRSETEHCIAVFLSGEGEFIPLPLVSENAESIHSISFSDLNGDGRQEIIVGWQVAGLRYLYVYTVEENHLVQVFDRRFSGYVLFDIEESGTQSLLLIYTDADEAVVEMITGRDGEYRVASSAFLSRGADPLQRIRTGPLRDGKPALYIASRYNAVPNSEVTDVIIFQEGNLVNISAALETGVSEHLVRQWEILADDITGNGVLDLPNPRELPAHPASSGDPFFEIQWGAYDSGGVFKNTAKTYHSFRDNWYLQLPGQWPERYTVRRDSVSAALSATVFSVIPQSGDPIDFLKIYYNNQPASSRHPVRDRQILIEHDNFLISAEIFPLKDSLAVHNISEDELMSLFNIIPTDWRIP
jgi:hypothetical protein